MSQAKLSVNAEFPIPPTLAAACAESETRRDWLADLPKVVEALAKSWSLKLGPPFATATCAWVAPAARASGTRAVLKVAMPHFEADHEIEGLRHWNGDPFACLLDADEACGALLLEHCSPGDPLRERPEPEQDLVIAGLLRRLWRPAPADSTIRPLAEMLAYWSAHTLAAEAQWPDPGLVRAGLDLFEELPRSAPVQALLATDLHAGNVLSAAREPWLAIDPKPFIGDPAYDATQHLLNCRERLDSDLLGTIAGFAELAGLEPDRVRLWLFARLASEPRDAWSEDPLTIRIAP